MKGRHIVIFIAFGINILAGFYAVFSSSLKSNVHYREENTLVYNNIVKFVNSSNADYKVLSGRVGGTFTFEIYFSQTNTDEDFVDFIKSMGFSKSSLSENVFCNQSRGIRMIKLNQKLLLEYERNLSQCK